MVGPSFEATCAAGFQADTRGAVIGLLMGAWRPLASWIAGQSAGGMECSLDFHSGGGGGGRFEAAAAAVRYTSVTSRSCEPVPPELDAGNGSCEPVPVISPLWCRAQNVLFFSGDVGDTRGARRRSLSSVSALWPSGVGHVSRVFDETKIYPVIIVRLLRVPTIFRVRH
jgi:hypothetical protein